MALDPQQVAVALDAVAERLGLADAALQGSIEGNPVSDWLAGWHLEIVYTHLLTLAEAQELPQLRADIARDFEAA